MSEWGLSTFRYPILFFSAHALLMATAGVFMYSRCIVETEAYNQEQGESHHDSTTQAEGAGVGSSTAGEASASEGSGGEEEATELDVEKDSRFEKILERVWKVVWWIVSHLYVVTMLLVYYFGMYRVSVFGGVFLLFFILYLSFPE